MAKFINELNIYKSISCELIFDKSLSDRARFLYCYMAAKPDEWEFFLEPMAKDIGYSVDTLRKYINELVASGWILKGDQQSGEKGQFGAVEYTLKATKNTDTENFRYGKNPTQYNIDNKDNKDNKEKEIKKKTEIEEFVNRIYSMYPTKCPIRNMSLGKGGKDKERIRKLLKIYTEEEIEKVVRHEVDEKYGKHMMQNLSTFLNNFPDPKSLFGDNKGGSVAYPQSIEDIQADDRFNDFYQYQNWMEKKCTTLIDQIVEGFPDSEKLFMSMVSHTTGGMMGYAYVCLVLMRDGWEKYDDVRGFMWIYSNYIKANGLYKE